jgi:VIT1/CCC1 family predicted Fe2+/Mn2+ transporter
VNIALWVLAGGVAAVFLASGAVKLARPKPKLAASGMEFVEDFGGGTVKGIGALEILGAVGLVLPALVGVAVFLVPLAAVGLALLMLGAVVTHVRRHEPQGATVAGVLLVLTVLLLWGRLASPFAS